jgi:hypothetical protein
MDENLRLRPFSPLFPLRARTLDSVLTGSADFLPKEGKILSGMNLITNDQIKPIDEKPTQINHCMIVRPL